MVQVLSLVHRVVKLRDHFQKSFFKRQTNFLKAGPEVLQPWVRDSALGPFVQKNFFSLLKKQTK